MMLGTLEMKNEGFAAGHEIVRLTREEEEQGSKSRASVGRPAGSANASLPEKDVPGTSDFFCILISGVCNLNRLNDK